MCTVIFAILIAATTTASGKLNSRLGVTEARGQPPYHRRPTGCCILAGDTDGGGLDMEMPVAGLMMGMALRARVAEGWWSFSAEC